MLISVFGLVALGVSLAAGGGKDGRGSTTSILLWLGVTAGVAIVLVLLGRKLIGVAVADGVAAGLFFSIGDISTKVATQGGVRIGFVVTLAFRTSHSRAAVPGAASGQVQRCALNQGNGPACAPHYAWQPVPTRDGPTLINMIATATAEPGCSTRT